MRRDLDQLIDSNEPAIQLIQGWVAAAAHECEILPPSDRRGEVLEALQVTTRSPLGALAYDTGGLLIQHGWLRFLGSGHPRISRDLQAWNHGRADGFFLVADDAAGGFFALNGGGLGEDLHSAYYWAPDDLEWLSLRISFTELLQSFLSARLDEFYTELRWQSWQQDAAALHGDQCFSFYPFLWTKEGSVSGSHRRIVPVSEAFDLKVDILKQLADGG